jgi:hypothetical protein
MPLTPKLLYLLAAQWKGNGRDDLYSRIAPGGTSGRTNGLPPHAARRVCR